MSYLLNRNILTPPILNALLYDVALALILRRWYDDMTAS